MKNVYVLLALSIFSTKVLAQIKISENLVTITPQFHPEVSYTYKLSLKKIVDNGEEKVTEINQEIPVKISMYSQGEGFNLFEWESLPMLFFRNNVEEETYIFPNESIKINYRTDENFVLGEVSNYDEIIQKYTLAYQQLYKDESTNFEDLSAKSSLYFVQMFHMFFGQEFSSKNKEIMMNLFYNPMKNTFSAAEDAITFTNSEDKASFNFTQTYNVEMEDNSAKMMNHKTVDSFRSKQTGTDYELKAWGSQSFVATGLVHHIERVVQVKQNGKTIQFVYTFIQD